jgi:hypothetical protein
MPANIVASGTYTLEIDTGAPVRGFRLDDALRGVLDGTTYVLDGLTDFADVTDSTTSINVARGRENTSDAFPAGILTFRLDDTAAGGVFNPFANDGPYYDPSNDEPGIAPNRVVNLYRDTELLFTGRIIDYAYNFGLSGDDTVSVTAADDFYRLAQTTTDEVHIDQELSGSRVETVLDLATVNYPTGAARDIATGTVELAGHSGGGGGGHEADLAVGDNVLDYLRQVQEAEQGRLFVSRDGVLTFQNRIGVTLSSPLATFADDGTGYPYRSLNIDFESDKIVNLAYVTTINNKSGSAQDTDSQTKYFVQARAALNTLLNTDADATALAEYLLNPEPEATFNAVSVAFSDLTPAQRDTLATADIGDTIAISKTFVNGESVTTLTQELAIEGIRHELAVRAGHLITFYTSPTTIVFELILDDPTYGVLDANNALG